MCHLLILHVPTQHLDERVRLFPCTAGRTPQVPGASRDRAYERAQQAESGGKAVSAAQEYFRASTYYRCALFCFAKPEDPRMVEYSNLYKQCFAKYLELSDFQGEVVAIPYEDTALPGYFFRSPVAGGKAPLLVVTPGRDTFAEDAIQIYGGALKRGIHCLVYDGPGQGAALRLQDFSN